MDVTEGCHLAAEASKLTHKLFPCAL